MIINTLNDYKVVSMGSFVFLCKKRPGYRILCISHTLKNCHLTFPRLRHWLVQQTPIFIFELPALLYKHGCKWDGWDNDYNRVVTTTQTLKTLLSFLPLYVVVMTTSGVSSGDSWKLVSRQLSGFSLDLPIVSDDVFLSTYSIKLVQLVL